MMRSDISFIVKPATHDPTLSKDKICRPTFWQPTISLLVTTIYRVAKSTGKRNVRSNECSRLSTAANEMYLSRISQLPNKLWAFCHSPKTCNLINLLISWARSFIESDLR